MSPDQILECAALELSEARRRLERFSEADLHVAAALDHVNEARTWLRTEQGQRASEMMARNLAILKEVRP